MRVGATIFPNHMELLKKTYTQIRVSPKYTWALADSNFRAPGKIQVETALRLYKNDGTPYDFDAVRCDAMGCGKAQEDLADDTKLQRCGKCREAFYCGKECQTTHWMEHKKSCKTPEQAEADRRKEQSKGGYMLMNV